ncbi:PRC-barrel domain protein [Acidithiobacillus ferrivorans SS3]|jgi:sporulation protein YlmC with PRC-barrel domain|uniref:PRC-barrel domain protein n=1 Tax=Acidithiobacillus ferrivorans SS3 TaxID=743299 RepID=G0JMT9_9PROT|nr:PRC-barrel domain-containing protein [Acidithiobacillus ferrivorans]AEM48222.1 PRC-barrel domain protein [Acidithiobacillus ferrivorans SS3]OFA15237.1 photosystem reaction center subunit H [Acidithiobacillus ferrivorans]
MNYEERDPYGIYKNRVTATTGTHVMDDYVPALMGANTLIGNDVYNQREEDLGSIKEIMLDMRSGKVAYAVLSFGGFLSMGEKLFAVPWTALTLDTTNRRFILNVEKDYLRDAPGFDKDQWPNMTDHTWSKSIDAFYGAAAHTDDRGFGGRGM